MKMSATIESQPTGPGTHEVQSRTLSAVFRKEGTLVGFRSFNLGPLTGGLATKEKWIGSAGPAQ